MPQHLRSSNPELRLFIFTNSLAGVKEFSGEKNDAGNKEKNKSCCVSTLVTTWTRRGRCAGLCRSAASVMCDIPIDCGVTFWANLRAREEE